MPEAKIKWPKQADIYHLAAQVAFRCPAFPGAFAFMEGFTTPIAASTIQSEQNPYWSGWKHQALCSTIIVTSSDGIIRWAAVNYPGSWHDSTIARPLFVQLEAKSLPIPNDHYILADSAFRQKGHLATLIRTPLNQKQYLQADQEAREAHRNVVSIRQAAEWAVRDIKGTYPRVRGTLPTNNEKRQQILVLALLLSNFRTRLLGLSQVRSVYNAHREFEILSPLYLHH
jgi:hypothetical protein